MRVLAVSLLALAAAACGSRSRSADEISPLDARRSLPTPERTLAPAVVAAPSDAGAVESPPTLPRMASLDAFGEGDRIADLAAVRLGDRTLLAWVTYFDPNPLPAPKAHARGGTQETSPASTKQGASVMVRELDPSGEPVGSSTVISMKAESVGGVALAAALGSREDVALAWVGKDGGVGQVFVTQLSPSGEKRLQRMLTHTKGSCSDVTLAATASGWLVAWIDSHDGFADVNIAKLGKDLVRIGAEHRVVESKGDASDVHLLVGREAAADEIILAWNEIRDDAALSAIFAARLTSADLTVRGDPVRVSQAPHARGLNLAPIEDGFILGWIEDDAARPPSGGASGAREAPAKRAAVLARLDSALRFLVEPVRPPLASEPSAIALECEQGCRVVVPSADQEQLLFYGFGYDGERSVDRPARLSVIPGASTEDVSPVLVGDWLFFAEDNLHGGGRLRRAKIVWR